MKEKRFRENEIEKLLKWYKTREVWLSFLEGNKEQTELDDIKQQKRPDGNEKQRKTG